jgi:hypothetical protein
VNNNNKKIDTEIERAIYEVYIYCMCVVEETHSGTLRPNSRIKKKNNDREISFCQKRKKKKSRSSKENEKREIEK